MENIKVQINFQRFKKENPQIVVDIFAKCLKLAFHIALCKSIFIQLTFSFLNTIVFKHFRSS